MANGNQAASFDTESESKFVNARRSNVKSDLIEITEDKLENILLKHLKRMGTRQGWVAPLGIFIAVILAIVTGAFSERFGISANAWEAIFLLASISSFVWLVVSLIQVVAHWDKSTTTYLISLIKNSTEESSTNE